MADAASLVRVQASQPNNSLNRRHLNVQTPSYLGYYLGYSCPSLDKSSETEDESTTKKALEATLPGPFNLTVARQQIREGPRSLWEWGLSAYWIRSSMLGEARVSRSYRQFSFSPYGKRVWSLRKRPSAELIFVSEGEVERPAEHA